MFKSARKAGIAEERTSRRRYFMPDDKGDIGTYFEAA